LENISFQKAKLSLTIDNTSEVLRQYPRKNMKRNYNIKAHIVANIEALMAFRKH
jgi:hypothetical protein